jgi:ABC-type sugar transport system permease subunit
MIVLLPWAFSEYATGVAWRWMLSGEYGFLNALLLRLNVLARPMDFINVDSAIYLNAIALAWHVAPLGAFFLLAGLQVIPEDLYRQARIDGAGALSRFRNVTIPFINYALLITIVLATIFSTNALDSIILMSNGGPGVASTTATYIAYKETFISLNLGYGAAISYIILVVTILLATAYFRLLTRRR